MSSRAVARLGIRGLRRLLVAAVAVLVIFGTCGAARAEAGTYVVVQCHPQQADGVTHWNPQSGGGQPTHLKFFNACGSDTGMGVYEEGATTANGSWGGLYWWAPPGSYFSQVEYQNRRTGGAGWSTFIQNDNQSAPVADADNDWAARKTTLGQFTSFAVFVSCGKAGGCAHNNAHNHVRRLWFTVVDPHKPTLSLGGELIGAGIRHGTETVAVNAADAGAGIARASIDVNGQPLAAADWTISACAITNGAGRLMTPCPTSQSWHVPLSTENGPWVNGANTMTVCASDFAGNTSCETRTVHVDNTCPSSGGTAAAALDAGMPRGSSLAERAQLRSDQEPVVRGRLTTASGAPVEGATVCVYEKVDLPDASAELVARPRTQTNGNFATALDPGPSRQLTFVYRYNNRVIGDTASIASVVAPSLRVKDKSLHNGDNARFRGQLPGPNASNRAVILQARAGNKWRTFKQVRTTAGGAFHGLYRFTSTCGRVAYVFRARVKGQGGYPYLPGGSRKRKVSVRGPAC